MTPIELLSAKLLEFETNLQKSFAAFQSGAITKQLHETHKLNLNPKIFQYKQAIQCLKDWTQ